MDCEQYNIFINKEEHLTFMFNTGKNLLKELSKCIKIVDKIGF